MTTENTSVPVVNRIEVAAAIASGMVLVNGSYRPAPKRLPVINVDTMLGHSKYAEPTDAHVKASLAARQVYILATTDASVSFSVQPDGNVVIQTYSKTGPYDRSNRRKTLSREAARNEYRRLWAAGYRKW
jgi:hypothetical protein